MSRIAILAVFSFVAVAAAGIAVGRASIDELAPSVPPTNESYTFAAVEGRVERLERVRVDFEVDEKAVISSQLPQGTITSLDPELVLDSVNPRRVGFRLGSVDEFEVRVEQGAAPMYRDLSRGSTGSDVAQLQQFLFQNNFLAIDPDGEFGYVTDRAVRDWQEASGQAINGRVVKGQFIFVEGEFVVLATEVRLGDTGVVLEVAVVGNSITPKVRFEESETTRIEVGQVVRLDLPESMLVLDVVAVTVTSSGTLEALLSPMSIADVDTIGVASVGADLVVVDTTDGVLVPPAAIQTAESGSYVVDVDGERILIEVIAQDGGVVVVEGLASGTEIRLGE